MVVARDPHGIPFLSSASTSILSGSAGISIAFRERSGVRAVARAGDLRTSAEASGLNTFDNEGAHFTKSSE